MSEPIRLVPYDPDWPARFESERALLEGNRNHQMIRVNRAQLSRFFE